MRYFIIPLVIPQVKRFLKETFFAGLAISVVVYIWVRLLFFEVPLSFHEDALNLFRIIISGWVMIMLLKGSFYLLLSIAGQLQRVTTNHRLNNK